MAKNNYKLLHLIAELGDLLEYANTGWNYREEKVGEHIIRRWANKWKTAPEPLPPIGLPRATKICPCTTPIHVHF